MDTSGLVKTLLVVISLHICWAALDLVDTGEVHAYCQWDDFNATCDAKHVILMKSAQYGRMKLNRCIKTDVYIGCSSDILLTVDQSCSGRHHCLLEMPDESLHQHLPCPSDLMAYLEASYVCVPVSSPEDSECNGPKLVTGPEGYIANVITDSLGLGRSNCPWRVEVKRGQRINVTLLDFTLQDHIPGDGTGYRICNVYANIREGVHERETNVCGGQRREQQVYTSDSNIIEIDIISTAEQKISFLLHYTAIGCPDPQPPKEAWFTRADERATIRCNHTSQTWHVVCKGNTWFGDVTNCSAEFGWGSNRRGIGGVWPPYGLLVAVIIGVVLGIVLGLGLLGVVLMCRRHRRRAQEQPSSELCATYDTKEYHEQAKIVRPSEQGYTHVWELRSHRDPREPKGAPMDLNMQKLSVYHDRAHHVRTGHEPGRHGKDHIYESPKFERRQLLKCSGTSPGPAACFHECPHGGTHHHSGTLPSRKKPEIELISEDSEEELDQCHLKPPNRQGYRPVPAGTLPRREPPQRFILDA